MGRPTPLPVPPLASGPARHRRGAASEVHAQLAMGTTGPRSLAGVTQTSFHRLSRDLSGSATSPPDPAGWSIYQTANRVTADLSVRSQFDAVQANAWLGSFTAATGSVLAVRLSPRACLDAGTTFDGASLGLEVRSGLMAITGRHARAPFPLELWAFARGDRHWIANDGLIEGPLLGGVTTLVSASRWVDDLDVGVTARLGGVELEYAQLWRSSEISPLPPGSRRIHDVGRFRVALLY